jgi:hypothetical protein
MTREARFGDDSRIRHRTCSDRGRAADWGSAVLVALVLSMAVFIAAIVIAAYDDSVLVASRRSISTDGPRTAQGAQPLETDGSAR